jgi:hypothetical protein
MNVDVKIKADIVKAVWTEDFHGVETLRASVYNVLSALTVASFALSAFLFRKEPRVIYMVTDGFMIVFIWTIFLIIKRDIRNRRKALIYRQNLIENLDADNEQTDMKVFGDASHVRVDIHDDDLVWIPVVGTAAILVKACVLLATK